MDVGATQWPDHGTRGKHGTGKTRFKCDLRSPDGRKGRLGLTTRSRRGGRRETGALFVRGSFEQTRLALVQRQPNAEGGPAADLAFKFDFATVRSDDALHNHESQAGA